MSKRSITLAILLTLAIILAPAGMTLGASADATETISGTIVSSTEHSLILDTVDGNETFVLRAETELSAELEVGSTVTVTFVPTTDGREPVAGTVTVDLAPYEHLEPVE